MLTTGENMKNKNKTCFGVCVYVSKRVGSRKIKLKAQQFIADWHTSVLLLCFTVVVIICQLFISLCIYGPI